MIHKDKTYRAQRVKNKKSVKGLRFTVYGLLFVACCLPLTTAAQEPQHVTVNGSVFGGGNMANVSGSSSVLVNQSNASIGEDVYGGGAKAHVNSADGNTLTANAVTTVTITTGTVQGSVYGGGLGDLASEGTGHTNVEAKVLGPVTVNVNGANATVGHSVYGCNNLNGAPQNSVTVTISNGTVTEDVFGGGNLASASVSPVVNIEGGTVTRDVYGGGALASTGANDGTTQVNIMDGTVGRDVYGGGLGRKTVNEYVNPEDPTDIIVPAVTGIAAVVNGDVHVKVGDGTYDASITGRATSLSGSATINGSVYGCNNLNGSPTGNVYVDIFQTYHTVANTYPSSITTLEELQTASANYNTSIYADNFAIEAVYGGGNQAAYAPVDNTKIATVHIYTCVNTIQSVYGGGNAADATKVKLIVEGGRFDQVFGGGNGYSASRNHDNPYDDGNGNCTSTPSLTACADYNPGANISGSATTEIHGGLYRQLFGGSNQYGNVNNASLSIDNAAGCTELILESFGGANEAEITGDVTTNLLCSNVQIGSFYGGSNAANITGDVTLNVYGGQYINVFGGSKGVIGVGEEGDPNYVAPVSADITGNVTLNLFGGTMTNAFGGSDQNGNITKNITVNMLDFETATCGLQVHNIYGAGNLTPYTPTEPGAHPTVNIIHGNVSKNNGNYGNVFGGGFGGPATVSTNTVVNIGYDATIMGSLENSNSDIYKLVHSSNTYSPAVADPANYAATVSGNVYGGGEQAAVTGGTSVTVRKGNTTVSEDVYGGGALANVGTEADNSDLEHPVAATTHTVTIADGSVRTVYGGGMGRLASGDDEAIAALVNGNTVVNINGGTVSGTEIVSGTKGAVFGGCNVNGTVLGNATVTFSTGGTVGTSEAHANVYGGGLGANTNVQGSVTMTLGSGSTIYGDVYGGSAKGLVNCTLDGNTQTRTTDAVTGVTLSGTAVHGDIYGGGHGIADAEANVLGPVTVTINSNTLNKYNTSYGGNVFGCNNAAGAPKNSVQVNINNDVPGSVYGGGNLAAASVSPAVYVNKGTVSGSVFGGGLGSTAIITGTPTVTVGDLTEGHGSDVATVSTDVYGGGDAANVNGTPVVRIQKCNTVVTGDVYGGGNAANVFATNVTVTGGTINYVFGGGHGDKASLGGPHTDKVANVTSNANPAVSVAINGGTISKVFAGSNLNGSITGTSSVNVNKTGTCTMKIGEVYGGGNEAAGNAGTITIGCTGDLVALGNNQHYGVDQEGIRYVYGGANQADIGTSESPSNITLNIYSGIVENVFGGNNTSGDIYGTITVNINKDNNASCVNNWYVGNVYGGGNLAPYSAPAGSLDYPEVNILNGAVSGDVFGGGLGPTAIVTGNPQVTVNGSGASVAGGVYGGGSEAATTGDPVVTLTTGTLVNVYGGGKAANVTGDPTVNIDGGTVSTGVYGGCNTSGTVSGDITVLLTGGQVGTALSHADVYGGGYGGDSDPTDETPAGTYTTGDISVTLQGTAVVYGDLYGGSSFGSVGASNKTATVNLENNNLHGSIFGGGKGQTTGTPYTAVTNGDVEVNIKAANANGNLTGVYGGANAKGNVVGDIEVNIQASVGQDASHTCDIFGGGLGPATTTGGDVTVNVGDNAGTYTPVVYGDVYGGSSLGSVNNDANDKTTVNILSGILNNNIYGGGMGQAGAGNDTKGQVNGTVEVNIGSGTANTTTGVVTNLAGNATINGNVYGCNNTNGSPMADVNVNIYQTAHTESPNNHYAGTDYAIANVFGGGNHANYTATSHRATVTVYTCANTIGRVFGGGDAAAAEGVGVTIWGGRFNQVFGGGNGENTAANVGTEGTNTNIHGGSIRQLFGGSNARGSISGTMQTNVLNDGGCGENITSFFGGANAVDITGDVVTTINCGTVFDSVYGGSNKAQIYGNVTLTVMGGTMNYLFGGSKGVRPTHESSAFLANIADDPVTTEVVEGNVTLNIYGGTIANAFGGSDQNGNITGSITVNVLDHELDNCEPLSIGNLYGSGNLTAYTPTSATTSPVVNVMHIRNGQSITGDVFGGGKGQSAEVKANPKVNIGYDASTMSTYVPENFSMPATTYVTIDGSVFGGGDAAAVASSATIPAITGSTTVIINSGTVKERVIGGGNAANVSGNTDITVYDGIFGTGTGASRGVYGGCNEAGTVGGDVEVNILGGTFGTQASLETNNTPYNIHGGGFGQSTGVSGNVTVNYGAVTYSSGENPEEIHTEYPKLYGDIYGGSALGNVNSDDNDETTVNILNGSIESFSQEENGRRMQYGGNIYGGGLGQQGKAAVEEQGVYGQEGYIAPVPAVEPIAALVNGVVHVNIGAAPEVPATVPTGMASIKGCNVYGCNNLNGSPQQNVYVDVYKTYHTEKDLVTYLGDGNDREYAIRYVFGGGNEANYAPTGNQTNWTKKTHNHIHYCDNTVQIIYGGGNAADCDGIVLTVDGGRFDFVFGGGNGQYKAANILDGSATIYIHAGRIGWYFQGCNLNGTIGGTIEEHQGCSGEGCCGDLIVEKYYFGANQATIYDGVHNVIECADASKYTFTYLYAGSRLAIVYGDIELTVRGGTITNLFGGSEGSDDLSADVRKYPASYDDIDNFPVEHQAGLREHFANNSHDADYGKGGNIILTVEGGDITNVFGGNDYRGRIEGNITVIIDSTQDGLCKLDVDYVYGGNRLSYYAPDSADDGHGGKVAVKNPNRTSPLVQLVNGHVNYDVYGGSKGGVPTHHFGNGIVISNPKVEVGDNVAGHKFRVGHNEVDNSGEHPVTHIYGDVYGGGSAADVKGNTTVILQDDTGGSSPTIVERNVFGGGKSGDVDGNTSVIIVPTNN